MFSSLYNLNMGGLVVVVVVVVVVCVEREGVCGLSLVLKGVLKLSILYRTWCLFLNHTRVYFIIPPVTFHNKIPNPLPLQSVT
jgi:hypothetical protein